MEARKQGWQCRERVGMIASRHLGFNSTFHGLNQQHSVKSSHSIGLQDKVIGKRVFSMSGSVPAANYIQLPKAKGPILGLTGQFLYLQVLSIYAHSSDSIYRKNY